MISMFQTNSVAMGAERWVGWKRASDTAVVVLDNVQY
jgi:hypothetical protein